MPFLTLHFLEILRVPASLSKSSSKLFKLFQHLPRARSVFDLDTVHISELVPVSSSLFYSCFFCIRFRLHPSFEVFSFFCFTVHPPPQHRSVMGIFRNRVSTLEKLNEFRAEYNVPNDVYLRLGPPLDKSETPIFYQEIGRAHV